MRYVCFLRVAVESFELWLELWLTGWLCETYQLTENVYFTGESKGGVVYFLNVIYARVDAVIWVNSFCQIMCLIAFDDMGTG